jgi:hypothetical protein
MRQNEIMQILYEQLKVSYKEFQIEQHSGGCYIKDNFIVPGIGISINGNRVDFVFDKFDILDYDIVESYLKPRLVYEKGTFYFNKRQINFYLYKDFALTAKGDFEFAMYIFNGIEFVKKEIENLLKSIDKLPH